MGFKIPIYFDDIKAATSRTQIIEPVGLGLDESSAATMLMDAVDLPTASGAHAPATAASSAPAERTGRLDASRQASPSIASQKTMQASLPSELALSPTPRAHTSPHPDKPLSFGSSSNQAVATPPHEDESSLTTSQRNILIALAIFVLLLFIVLAILGLIFILKKF